VAAKDNTRAHAPHIPLRTCVGCRKVQAKAELVRIVRTPDGTVQVDPSGKQRGRGAYVCAKRACVERALTRGALGHALRIPLDVAALAEIQAWLETLPAQATVRSPRRNGTSGQV
jgi:predicted RNA-binding protein YlxR (DUF448 family)